MHDELAKLIREHRKARYLTQADLAREAGVGKTVIFDIEHAKPTVQLDTVLKILSVLGISLSLRPPPIKSTPGKSVNAPSARESRSFPAQPDSRKSDTPEEVEVLPAHLL
jgi:y4mF family transcriptional regulator